MSARAPHERRTPAWRRYLRFFHADVAADVDDELRFHIESATNDLIARGMSADDARRAALARFGDVEGVRGWLRAHDQRRETHTRRRATMRDLWQDLRHAARALRHQPTFTLAAVLSLALGIGATTVIFSVVDAIVLRPLPYRDADRLVVVREVIEEMKDVYPTTPANAGHFLEWQRGCTGCEGVAAVRGLGLTLTGQGEAERVGAARVSASLFSLLGVQPRLGRGFLADEDRPGHERVAIITDGLWHRRFGADPSIIGKTIGVGDWSVTVVGVLPPSFRFPRNYELGLLAPLPELTELFIPLALQQWEIDSPGGFDFSVIARLKPGVTPERARGEIDAIQRTLGERSRNRVTLRSAVTPLREQMVGGVSEALIALLAGVGAVLLIVCANLANLLLARNASRSRERAIRVALGASRSRIFGQALIESLLLAVTGGALGLLIARFGIQVLMALAPSDLPRAGEVGLDLRVALFALAASLATGLLFGTVPALRATRVAPASTLRGGGHLITLDARGTRLRRMLIVGEVALSTVLLVAAGLFIGSLARVLRVDRGFDVNEVVAANVTIPATRYDTPERRSQFFEQLLATLSSTPGVRSAGLTSVLPLSGEAEVNDLSPVDGRHDGTSGNIRFVSGGYFATIGTPIKQGRTFDESDRNRPAIVISENTARALWPGESPLGKRMQAGDLPRFPVAEVIGVVADVHTKSLEDAGTLIAYRPWWDEARRTSASVLVRTSGDASTGVAALRAAVARLDPSVPLTRVRTMREIVSASTARRRFETVLMGAFALTALLVAAVGIYGVLAYSLAQRTTELGIRLALGALPGDVQRLALRQGLAPVVLGLALGLIAALAAGRVIASLLFGVQPSDPVILSLVVAVLGVVAVAACWWPARRVARVAPSVALRGE